jgi:PIN domain nuclease of toxin-antitoxin system
MVERCQPTRLKKGTRTLAHPANTLLFSVVTAWEMVLKSQAGKLRLTEPPGVYVPTRMPTPSSGDIPSRFSGKASAGIRFTNLRGYPG